VVLTSQRTNLSDGMRKGSVFVRTVAGKGLYAVLMVSGIYAGREILLSSSQDERYVVCCIGYLTRYSSTEVAHHSRFANFIG